MATSFNAETSNDKNEPGRKESSNSKKLKMSHERFPAYLIEAPEVVFQSLISPFTVSDFFNKYWEKEPLVILATESKTSIVEWFSKAKALELLTMQDLKFYLDVHFCTCEDGRTKDLNKEGRVTAKDFSRLIDKMGATAQIHQVQRFVNPLWYVIERLESLFGCLVGTNVYITPPGTQGLAPHYDDVEVFICQLEGTKHWRLYKPPVELAREYRINLPAENIGQPSHEFVLKAGDILYMPRGTVHQADTPSDSPGHSTHITISTYQRHTVGDYLRQVLPSLIAKGFQSSLELRRGLPVKFFQSNTGANLSDILNRSLKCLTESLSQSEAPYPTTMIEDFMKSRLPPYMFDPQVLEESPDGPKPTLRSRVSLTYPNHVTFALAGPEQGDDDEEEDSGDEMEASSSGAEPRILVYSSLGNKRQGHMINSHMNEEEEGEDDYKPSAFYVLKFSGSLKSAMEQLLVADTPVEVKSLGSVDDEMRLHLVTTLWAEHLLTVQVL